MSDAIASPNPNSNLNSGTSVNSSQPAKSKKWLLKLIMAVLAILFTVNLVLMWLWSREPEPFETADAVAQYAPAGRGAVTGVAVVATLMRLNEGQLSKSGGYISNDIAPPGVFLDNISNFEFGELQQLRDLASALRNDFSRSQSQSVADKNLENAQPLLMYPNDRWIPPSTESQYREANVEFNAYLVHLTDPNQPSAQFYARADNLEAYLRLVEKQLGSLSQRLSASVTHARHDTDLANEPNATQSTPGPATSGEPMFVQTPWRKIDDNFYEARGASYALIHILKAIEVDFKPILDSKNAKVSVQQIIAELEQTQAPIWSPMILNGGGFGFFPNHSLVMANYVSRASAQIANLRALLARG